STSIALNCSGMRAMPRMAKNPFQEENRPRWGVRTSNPGGAASRSLVGSTPSLFRHVQKQCNDTCDILSPCEGGSQKCQRPENYPGAKSGECTGCRMEALYVR